MGDKRKTLETVAPTADALTGTVFHQKWMLDAASAGRWEQIELTRDGVCIARMPYIRIRRLGLTRVMMPSYIRVLGPILNLPHHSKAVMRLHSEVKIILDLMQKLPNHTFFRQSLSPEFDYSAAFVMAGWNVHLDYTFRIAPDLGESTVLNNMHQRARSDVKNSLRTTGVRQHNDLELFIALAKQQAASLNTTSYHRFDVIKRIFIEAEARNQAKILTVSSESEPNLGTAIVLFDERVLYFWVAARRVQAGNRAYTRLIWEAFLLAKAKNLIFDLDGFYSDLAGNYLASFGATPVPRPWVNYYGLGHRIIRLGKDVSTVARGQPLGRRGLAGHIAPD